MAKINGRDVPDKVAWGQKPADEEYAKGSMSPPSQTPQAVRAAAKRLAKVADEIANPASAAYRATEEQT